MNIVASLARAWRILTWRHWAWASAVAVLVAVSRPFPGFDTNWYWAHWRVLYETPWHLLIAYLFLIAIAIGYQLDKFELVYSTRGIATGVSYTDFNAQLLAFDVLTGLSAIAAAFLVGGALSRVAWPLALTVAVWFLASIGIGRIYPEVIQRFTVQPNQPALESPYMSNNIAMTRRAFDLDGWETRDYRGEAPLSEG